MAKLVRAIHPNAGIQAAYRRRLRKLIDEMQRSVVWWVRAAYRQNEDRIAQDASPARMLQKVLNRLFSRWSKRWADEAEKIAHDFVGKVSSRTIRSYEQAIKAAGFTVKMDASRLRNDTVQALIAENVSLINSIGFTYRSKVNELVQRSVVMGRDWGGLIDDLRKVSRMTRQRADLIARDQTNKATQAIKRVEGERLGIKIGIWVHVPGKKTSRATHKAMNGKPFLISRGMYDNDVNKYVLPGELIACQCEYRDWVPEFGDKITPEIQKLLDEAK